MFERSASHAPAAARAAHATAEHRGDRHIDAERLLLERAAREAA